MADVNPEEKDGDQPKTLTHEQIGEIANKVLGHLYGLNRVSVKSVLNWVENSLDKCYFLSNPKDLRNS